jgi:hypothetical protein
MRSDMKKVVVERPRGQSYVPNRKFGARLRYIPDHEYEEQPKRVRISESYRDYGYSGKWFTDLLGPLGRFLRSSLGRPWNDVYSELCAGLDKRKATGLHIFQHVEQMVERHCHLDDDGNVYGNDWRHGQIRGFFVHPRSGVLCEAPRETNREHRRRRLLATPVTRLELGDNAAYQKHNDVWYRVKLKAVYVNWRHNSPKIWDIFLKRETVLRPGWNWVATEKKQCNRNELRTVRYLLAEREYKIRRM